MKKLIFKTINLISALTFILSASSLDGERWIIPTVTMFVSLASLMVNNYRAYIRGEL